MEVLTKAAWAMLALLHLAPSLPFFAPGMVERLYGVDPAGDAGVLLAHRGALFLVVLVATAVAMWSVESRKLVAVLCAISMIGFLILYGRAGSPAGPLRKIAVADAVGLVPLAFVSWRAFS